MRARPLLLAASCLLFAACGDETPAQPMPGVPGGDVPVRPGSRLAWAQDLGTAVSASSFQFALYVDGVRTVLSDVVCGPAAAAVSDCSALLPGMSAGTHTLELAAFVVDGATVLESARSAPLRVVMGSAVTARTSSVAMRTADGVALQLTAIADGLESPSDIAVTPSGTLLVAERGGRVRRLDQGALQPQPALDLSADVQLPAGGLLALAVDPAFERTGWLYALYAAASPRGGQEFVLARFRGVDGSFAERAVLLDRVSASSARAAGALRIGVDGKLYAALDDAGDDYAPASLASYNGKVLRMNLDATTPDDQRDWSPVFALNHPQPQALAWQPGSRGLWVVDRLDGDAGRLAALRVGDPARQQSTVATAYALPSGTGASGAAFYGGDLMPQLRGDLFVAAAAGRHLLRVRFDPAVPTTITAVERLLDDQIGPVLAVAEGRDGALYVAGETTIYRLAPP